MAFEARKWRVNRHSSNLFVWSYECAPTCEQAGDLEAASLVDGVLLCARRIAERVLPGIVRDVLRRASVGGRAREWPEWGAVKEEAERLAKELLLMLVFESMAEEGGAI